METKSVKTRRYCSVPQCKSRPVKGVSLHYFPNALRERRKWIIACKIGKPVTKYMAVCSNHFTEDDYFKTDGAKRKWLKSTAFPTRNLPRRSLDNVYCNDERRRVAEARSERLNNRKKRVASDPGLRNGDITVEFEECSHQPSEHRQVNENVESTTNEFEECSHQPTEHGQLDENVGASTREMEAAEALLELSNISSNLEDSTICYEKGVQVIGSFLENSRVTLLQLLKSEAEIRAFAGISFALLDSLTAAVRVYEGESVKFICSTKERVLMTLCKLRLKLTFVCLGVLFNVNCQTCSNYFFDMIKTLSYVLQSAVYWPSKEEVISSMPKCFSDFPQTRIVLDCTEVPVEKPSCLQCRLRTYSHYKGRETVKILIGVAPSGLISYVSRIYGGRASDKAIFAQSKLLEKLIPRRDAIMVDKGFLIEVECKQYGIELIRPPFLGHKSQFSKEDALLTKKIAAARIHVERSIQRLKVFKMLSYPLSWSMVPYANDMFRIVAALVNLSSPILISKRF